jgi:uncharacterized membrane protein (DUF485 family)
VAEKISPAVHAEYERIHASADFHRLRSAYRRFVLPTTVAFMVWYLAYVLASNWAPDLMGTKVVGNINVALVWGLLQFVTTFGIAWAYASYSAKNMDPIADDLRGQFEREVER